MTSGIRFDPERCAAAAEACGCLNIRKASRVVTQLFDEALEPIGLRSTQLAILVTVAIHGPASVAKLSRELVMDPSTLARNLQPLLQLELIEKTPGPTGNRKLISLSDSGTEAITRAMPLWEAAQKRLLQHFGSQQWPMFVSFLSQAVAAGQSARSDTGGSVQPLHSVAGARH